MLILRSQQWLFYSFWFFSFLFLIYLVNCNRATKYSSDEEKQVYIVYMGSLPESEYSPLAHHISVLERVVNSNYQGKTLVRSYTRSFNGFAAYLTKQEQQKLAAHDDVVSIFPSKRLQLHTTASWDFIGFPQSVPRNLTVESDIIIGVLDSGIWPESESFYDHGFGPIPNKWKGACSGGVDFMCNNKIIGARYYASDSARDLAGHGTHVSSTAAGNNVMDVSYYGIVEGTMRGGVPAARIAVYKACAFLYCDDADILAGFDDAIADGVDIISISLGFNYPVDLKYDSIAIGSFHAAQKGILTVNSAGNNGLVPGQITSTAPWLFTIAASTINRKIISKVVLGNGLKLAGNAVNRFSLNGTKFPLIYGKTDSRIKNELKAKSCLDGCLDKSLVQGKIVVCCNYDGIKEASRAGAVGNILLTNELFDVSEVFPSAASALNHQQFRLVESYISSTEMPRASILTSKTTRNIGAPVIASFSSRGPNQIFPDILKPDISAPGVDILAAYPPTGSPPVNYNILSGTSMACPHVTGAAAYVKSFHPHWSPSAIKSALMTTALRLNATNARHGDTEFSYGAGNIDPIKATNPGLVYETLQEDNINIICNALNFSASKVRKIFRINTSCSRTVPENFKKFNYPSMAAQVEKSGAFEVKFQRTVTNVGLSGSIYKAKVSKNSQCNITVEPSILSFQRLNERKSFIVKVSGERVKNIISASLEWSDGVHNVRSPIVIYTRNRQ